MTGMKPIHKLLTLSLSAFIMLGAQMVSGQFYVHENTTLHIDRDVSTNIKQNTFNSSIHGSAELNFSGDDQQELYAADDVNLPGVNVLNVELLTLYTTVTINGDLNLEQSQVDILLPMLLNGNLNLDVLSGITGKHLISQPHEAQPYKTPWHQASSKIVVLMAYNSMTTFGVDFLSASYKKTFNHYNSMFAYNLGKAVPTPPPEI